MDRAILKKCLPGSGLNALCSEMVYASDCTQADKQNSYVCPECGVRVYLNLPRTRNGPRAYFATSWKHPHARSCPHFTEPVIDIVKRLDSRGENFSWEKMIGSPSCAQPKASSGEKSGTAVKSPKEVDEDLRDNALTVVSERVPQSAKELLVAMLGSSGEWYGGALKRDRLVCRDTIEYHRENGLYGPALAICMRSYPPKGLVPPDLAERCLVMQDPYSYSRHQKPLHFVAVFDTVRMRNDYMNDIMKRCQDKQVKTKRRSSDRGDLDLYVVYASWKPLVADGYTHAFIGEIHRKVCFQELAKGFQKELEGCQNPNFHI